MRTVYETRERVGYPISATVLTVLGWFIIIVGFILGYGIGQQGGSIAYTFGGRQFLWGPALLCWIGGIVIGTLFIGMGNIIDLLVEIANKDYVVKIEEEKVSVEEKGWGVHNNN